jgi:cyclic pyranopterin phosphate synthase
MPIAEVLSLLKKQGELVPLDEPMGFGPARYYRLAKLGVTVGVIGAMSDLHFCERCNKMRLTCDGKLRPCLGNHLETDLMPALRPSINEEGLQNLFLATLAEKPAEHSFRDHFVPLRVMTAIGG